MELLKEISDSTQRLIKGLSLVWDAVRPTVYKSASLDFYQEKGGQFQFSVGGPRWSQPRDGTGPCHVEKMGAVFVEAAPPDEANPGRLDWANKKISFALSDKDIGEILYGVRAQRDVKLIHSNEERTDIKTLSIGEGKDFKGNMTFPLSLQYKKADGNLLKVSIFISAGDMARLLAMLEASLPYIMGFSKA